MSQDDIVGRVLSTTARASGRPSFSSSALSCAARIVLSCGAAVSCGVDDQCTATTEKTKKAANRY
jgi:hypothetical protein